MAVRFTIRSPVVHGNRASGGTAASRPMRIRNWDRSRGRCR